MSINGCENCLHKKDNDTCKLTGHTVGDSWLAGRLCNLWRHELSRKTRGEERNDYHRKVRYM